MAELPTQEELDENTRRRNESMEKAASTTDYGDIHEECSIKSFFFEGPLPDSDMDDERHARRLAAKIYEYETGNSTSANTAIMVSHDDLGDADVWHCYVAHGPMAESLTADEFVAPPPI